MKKILVTLTAGTLLTLLTVGCDNRIGKRDLREAESDLKAAASETNKAVKAEAAAEWESFKYQSDTTLSRLEAQANVLEKSLEKRKAADKAALQIKLDQTRQQLKAMQDQLKMKNKEFEQEMKTFDQAVYNRNKAFQREFDHDMKDFGIAFSDLFKDNVK